MSPAGWASHPPMLVGAMKNGKSIPTIEKFDELLAAIEPGLASILRVALKGLLNYITRLASETACVKDKILLVEQEKEEGYGQYQFNLGKPMTEIKEQIIESWEDFDESVRKKPYRKWIYRGHPEATWKLESSLYRSFQNVQNLHRLGYGQEKKLIPYKHEERMIKHFKANAHLFLTHLPDDSNDLNWLALMQHYGAPSRLLDFTFSPYIAAYFCLETGIGDAAIYALDHAMLKQVDQDFFEQDPSEMYRNIMGTNGHKGDEFIYPFEPNFSTQRLMVQQGVFLIPNILMKSHESLLEDYSLTKRYLVKYIIPAELRAAGIKHLYKMNITSNMIYPGLEGFCKSMIFSPIFALPYQTRVG